MEHRSLSPDFIVSNDDHVGGNKCTRESTPDVAPQELRKEEQMGGPVNCNDSELSIYLQALAEGYLPTFYSDTSQSAQSKSMSIASKSFRRGKKTVVFHGFPSLKMSRHSTAIHGAELLTSWREGFRAKTSALPGTARGLMENAAECGTTWPASLAKFDPDTSSWKTAQLSLLGGLEEFSETWPRWGLMRNGECWERQTLVHRTSESASGLWQTPVADDAANRAAGKWNSRGEPKLSAQVMWPTPLANSHTGAGHGPNKTWAPNLQTMVAMWPTPTRDSATERTGRYAQGGLPLTAAVHHWPTPTVCGNYNRKGASATSGDGLATAVTQRTYPTATATAHKGWSPNHNRAGTDDRLDYTVEREAFNPGQQTPPMRLNPAWVEWLMGWPIGHTELKPLETDRCQSVRQWHGHFLEALRSFINE